MSKIRPEQLEYASKFMNALWAELIKPCYNPETQDEWWTGLIDKANTLFEKYGNGDPRLKDIAVGFIKGVDTVAKG